MSEKLYFNKYNKYKKKYLELKKMKGGEWQQQVLPVENPAFSSYKEDLALNKHCSTYFVSGDIHCKGNRGKVCGSVLGNCKCESEESQKMYESFVKWYQNPANRNIKQEKDHVACVFS